MLPGHSTDICNPLPPHELYHIEKALSEFTLLEMTVWHRLIQKDVKRRFLGELQIKAKKPIEEISSLLCMSVMSAAVAAILWQEERQENWREMDPISGPWSAAKATPEAHTPRHPDK